MRQKDEVVVNNSYLVTTYITCFVTSFPVGFVLASFNQAGIIIETQKGWQHLYTVFITASGIFGLMLGSLLCDKFIAHGRIKTIYLANVIIVLACVPQMALFLWSLMLGRFMMGFAGGLAIVSCSTFMAETVPVCKLGVVGTAVNSGIIFALLITSAI